MIIYNVTIKVQHDTVNAWTNWMKNEHMADVLSTGLFSECRLCRLLEHDDEDGSTFIAQYHAPGMAEYNAYIEHHAEKMREKGNKLFGGKFIAFRTVMEAI